MEPIEEIENDRLAYYWVSMFNEIKESYINKDMLTDVTNYELLNSIIDEPTDSKKTVNFLWSFGDEPSMQFIDTHIDVLSELGFRVYKCGIDYFFAPDIQIMHDINDVIDRLENLYDYIY